jgi:DNA-binding transcriptional LysR family regulator
MTLAQLEIFIALAEAGSFTAAAVRLGISQSAVSHAVGGLEKALEVTLFERKVTPIALTNPGERILRHARGVVAQANAIRQEASASRGLARGLLHIGSFGPTSSLRLLPELIELFHQKYPGVEVMIEEARDEIVEQWIIDRRVELGFVILPDERFETVQLEQDEYMAILPATHNLAKLKEVPVESFDGLPFIMSRAGSGEEIETLLGRFNAKPRVLYRMPQLISILGLVQRGLAVSIAATLALPENYPGVIYRPLAPRAVRRIALAMRDRTALAPVAGAFVDMAEEWAGKRKRKRAKP